MVIMDEQEEQKLKDLYRDPEIGYVGSESFIKKVKLRYPEISRKKIKLWLEGQDDYTSMKKVRRKGSRPRVIVSGKNVQWDIDSAVLKNDASDNDGYGYFLLAIDDLSKFIYTVPLKTLQAGEMVKALKTLPFLPKSIRSDRGSEYHNRWVKDWAKKNNVHWFYTVHETKANVAERGIKTLKTRLARYKLAKQTKRWIDVLDQFTKNYNETLHRTLGVSPKQAKELSDDDLWQRVYALKPVKVVEVKKEKEEEKKKKRGGFVPDVYKFKVGDRVKVRYMQKTFGREYDQQFSNEVFTVRKRYKNQGKEMYNISDFDNDPITGAFYVWQLRRTLRNHTFI